MFDLLSFFCYYSWTFLFLFFFSSIFFRYGLVWLLRKLRMGEFWGFCYWLCGTRNDEEFWIFLIYFISYVFSNPNKDNLPHSIPITVTPHQSNTSVSVEEWGIREGENQSLKKKTPRTLRQKHKEHLFFLVLWIV